MVSTLVASSIHRAWSKTEQIALLKGEILLHTRPYSAWGGAVTAQMYLPAERSDVWQQVTDYSRWVQFFPSLTQSLVLSEHSSPNHKRLYQVAGKTFLCFTAQVEIYLRVIEQAAAEQHQIQFQFERGSFNDFSAELKLQDFQAGTLLTYTVQASPAIPVPTQIIQEGIRLDLPNNMRSMRQAICGAKLQLR